MALMRLPRQADFVRYCSAVVPSSSNIPSLDRTLRLSRYAARVASARPGVVDEIARRGLPYTRDEMREALAGPQAAQRGAGPQAAQRGAGPQGAQRGAGDPAELGSRLRRLRERVMVSLAHRDLNGLASLAEVFATMTALAEESVAAALAEAHRAAAAVHGEPANGARLIVAALGKLGGGELNVSSDIDLVFLHAENGQTAGPRPVSNAEFYTETGKRLIALLSEPTAEGQAFRVDMRLRPFGDSGPLTTSLAALEDYFISHARPWERYAWLKARVIAGSAEGVRERVEPFVYRRYLDYGLLDALRELHARIFEAALQRRKTDDIKVGPGGIREIEFSAQLFQLVRGGRDAGLRMTSTRAALAALGERGLVTPERIAALSSAYAFLRRLEHRLQYYDDQQTQALPKTPEHRAVIAEAMDYPDWDALAGDLEVHRARVQAAFGALFEGGTKSEARGARLTASLFDPQASPDPDALAEQLAEAGIVEPLAVARRLNDYIRSRPYRSMSAGSRAKLERLLPDLVAAAAAEGGTEAVAIRMIELIEAIAGREAYFALLVEHPQVLARAARLVSRSLWAARLLTRHPILLDELTRSAASFTATDWNAERAGLAAEIERLGGDVERILDHLRHYKQRQMLRFTIADIEGELPVMALSDELSALADTILDVTLAAAAASLGKPGSDTTGGGSGPRRHEGDDAHPAVAGFSVVGYGKLGGKELGYASDLDVIFLYDDAMGPQSEKLARIAQRVNTWMTSYTGAGVLYETDLRLRPDGASGLLVSSLSAFRDYQLKRAWTWEHQALTRARAAAGDRELGQRFEQLRDQILAQPRDRARLFDEIVAMRRKMRAENKADATELKHIAGGIIDLEFAVQALVLAGGPDHPQLRENKGNHTLLKRAGDLGLIDNATAVDAANAYLALRRRAHQAALNDEEKVRIAPGELEPERTAVKRLWKTVFGSET
jgi:glutamate-ammonia-ligase adenylyltransferase